MKTTSLVLIGALAFAFPALAAAQQQGDPQRPETPETREQPAERQQMDRQYQPKPATKPTARGDSIVRLEANQISLETLKGADVVSQGGEKVGAVEDVVIDETGRVAAIVVRTGAVMGLGGKKVALPWHITSITAGADAEGKDKGKHRLQVAMNSDELNDLPEFEDKAASAEQPRN